MSSNSSPVLSDKDTNASLQNGGQTFSDGKSDGGLKSSSQASLEQQRQLLHSRMNNGQSSQTQYVSPSDGMVSPCTAKLSAYRQKHFMKVKPQTLFGKGSSLANETKHTSVEEDMSDHAMEDTGDGHGARDSS